MTNLRVLRFRRLWTAPAGTGQGFAAAMAGGVKGIDDGLLVQPVPIERPSRGINPRRDGERKGR